MLAGKTWGNTRELLNNPFVKFADLWIEPNRRCSLHLHKTHFNAFYVFSGQMIVEVHKAAYDLVDTTTLGPRDFMVVPPNEKHRFVTGVEGCCGVEFYYPAVSQEDIYRDDVGGAAR